jgi:toxin FitB
MRWFVDTSVLIPVFQPGHVHHERSFRLFATADLKSSGCALHSLPEVYATLTRLPGIHRASAEHALRFLETIENRFSLVTLDVAEYRSTIGEAAGLGIVGGTTYDALIGACARKMKAEIIYTWNIAHFLRLGEDVAERVRTP